MLMCRDRAVVVSASGVNRGPVRARSPFPRKLILGYLSLDASFGVRRAAWAQCCHTSLNLFIGTVVAADLQLHLFSLGITW